MIVLRTCTEVLPEDADRHGKKESRPLEAFRDAPAYVLLGDPGAGKTTAFETECEALGEQACKVSARDFLTFDPQEHSEWRGKTLFIDGLDEIRAGADDARTPFNRIRRHLDILGKPCFRLSCRVADWLGANDRRHLESVSPDSKVTVLRLDSLRDSDVAEILKSHPQVRDVDDVKGFIAAAKKQSVDGLLTNPQTLDLLAKAVAGGGSWPQNRLELFDRACSQVVREHNEEHQSARGSNIPPATDQLLDAAGRLCAVHLISGGAGYTLRGEPDEDYPSPDQCEYNRPEMLRPALATKLFKGLSQGCFSPVHRHIAEFLGARHLAGVIRDGLPARRVLALITGEDGIVVTEMRGLSAWLAAHCKEARAELIESDPIGVGLYGDIREFATDEKRALLKALQREGIRLDSMWRSATAFGALATPEMEPVLKEILTDSGREKEDQLAIDFVLCVLKEGEPVPGLSDLLLEIVRDDTCWPRVNTAALDAFVRNCPEDQDKTDKLKVLLADIQNGDVSDPDNELLGILLYELYPRQLSMSQVWDIYYEISHRESLYGMYWWFFWFGLFEKSSDEHVAELLDSLKTRFAGLRPAVKSSSPLENLPVKLLARGLKAFGDRLDKARLYDWLDLGFAENLNVTPIGDKEDIQEIRSWLEQRPEVQKTLVMEGLERYSESDEFWWNTLNVLKRWYGANPPSDFGLWGLKKAVSLTATRPLVAEHLLEMAFQAHRDHTGDADLSLEVLEEYARRNVRVRKRLDQLLSPSPIVDEHLKYQEKRQQEKEAERQQWFEYVRSNEAALCENRAPPYLLHEMATRYFRGGSNDIEVELRDPSLTNAVLMGIRSVIDREDVPDVEEIFAIREKGHWHYLGFPFLASLAKIEEVAPEELCSLNENQMRRALAFHYCLSSSNKPNWYRRLLDSRPKVVAEMLIQSATLEFRGGSRHISGLFALAHDPDHAQVAKHACLPLLRAFPTRCKLNQIENLDHLLRAALQCADRSLLQELIEKKLSRKSMNDAQRVYWLATGIFVASEVYGDRLEEFVQGREDRISHLMVFLENREKFTSDELGNPLLEALLRLVGNYAEPDQLWNNGPDGGYVGFVRGLIKSLSISPEEDASDALERLLDNSALSRWHDVLAGAQEAQRVIRRDARYRHPNIELVCRTLNGGTPANAGDLAALVMDRLCELAERIRTSNTDDWRQYWNVDQYNRPTSGKPEDACRDNLLSDLQNRLEPLGIDAQPEGQYANDKRSDIRVCFGGFNVPVEIKRNMHRDLWSAPRNQLIAQYTIAPASDGYGIYLVFWFGKEFTQAPPSGARPANAEELKERLKATLSPDEARKISVCVIDVSGIAEVQPDRQ